MPRGSNILRSTCCPFCGGNKPKGQILCNRCATLNVSSAWLLGYRDSMIGEYASRREAETEFPLFTGDEIERYLNGRDTSAAKYRKRFTDQ